jgi:hypothetical protein
MGSVFAGRAPETNTTTVEAKALASKTPIFGNRATEVNGLQHVYSWDDRRFDLGETMTKNCDVSRDFRA